MRAAFFSLLLCLGCGDDDRVSDAGFDGGFDSGADTGVDAPDADTAMPDEGVDQGEEDAGPQSCEARFPVDTDLVLADASETNIHPSAAWDGERIWLTYTTLETGTSFFDVSLRSVACDGSVGEEIRVNDIDGESELDSTIAVSGERILVGYQADSRSGETDAIRPFVRAFDLSGAPIGPATPIARERESVAITATNWMVQVGARDGGFLASGTWGVDELSAFQIYAQSLELDGTAAAPATDVAPTTTSQTNPALGEGGSPWYAWAELLDGGSQVYAGRPGEAAIEIETGAISSDQPSLSGSLIALSSGGGSRTDIYVRNLETGTSTSFGRLADADGAPAIAGDADGFVVAWLRNTSGLQHELRYVSGFESEGEFTISAPVVVPTSTPVFPYTPTLIALPDGAFFLAWSETERSPNLRVHGRFIRP